MKAICTALVFVAALSVDAPQALEPFYAARGQAVLPTEATAIAVDISGRTATTRIDHRIANPLQRPARAECELALPAGALATEVLLADDPDAADAQLTRLGRDRYRLRVEPVPAGGRRQVGFAYVEGLAADDGALRYRLDLTPEQGVAGMGPVAVRILVAEPHRYDLQVNTAFRGLAEETMSDSGLVIGLDLPVPPPRDFELTLRPRAAAPALYSWKPAADEMGYFALWPADGRYGAAFKGAGVEDVYQTPGGTPVQVGRYRLAGRFGGAGERLDFAFAEQTDAVAAAPVLLLDNNFADAGDPLWDRLDLDSGGWRVDGQQGHLRVRSGSRARALQRVHSSDYTIEARLRFRGDEGKLIFHGMDPREAWRLDLIASATSRLTLGGRQVWGGPPSIVENEWYHVLIEVNSRAVNVFINGQLAHANVPLDVVPDGRIGVGIWRADAEFDYVRVYQGTQGSGGARRAHPVARLWAGRQAALLEEAMDAHGRLEEMSSHLAQLGYTYGIATSETALYAATGGGAAGKAVAREYPVLPDSTAAAD